MTRALLRDAKHRARGRAPCMTQTRAFSPDGQAPPAWLYQSYKVAAHLCKDLHTSRPTKHPGNGLASCTPSSCKNRRRECSPAPKKGRETPEGAVFCALRNPAFPPEYLNRSTKCAAFDADLSTRHRHPAGREEVWRRAKRLLQVPVRERAGRNRNGRGLCRRRCRCTIRPSDGLWRCRDR